MAESRTEEVISTSDPTVEVIEEIQPDGTVLRKKKTTRTITKRVLSTSTKESETSGTSSTSTITSTGSSSSSSSSSSSEVLISSESFKDITSGETKETAKETTKEAAKETKETKEKEDATKSESKRAFKYKVFGEGDSQAHPFYRFLARFPLKSLPAQHQRPSPIKPVLYAYAPGWKVNRPKETTPEANETSEEKKEEPAPTTGSFDVDSLKWMAYLKFNNIDYDIRPAFEPNMSPSGKLPFLALPDGSFVTEDGFEDFVQMNGSPDAKLDINEAAEAFAFTALAESKIHAALIYTLWFEEAHFKNTTRSHYFGHHVPVLKTILAYQEKSSIVHSMLLTRTQIDRELIFEEAASAIDSIATLLGDSDYFFGKDAPSSLDAIVFAYLHVILTLPKVRSADDSGRSSELARIVRKHSNLFEYSQKMWRKYFSA
ncbi:MAG: hypothetical protein BYD32DRAFT_461744 [Podila humilis]|nr:MAG: hypothetical protein BYD32DRAFT_461744 [Podila humilis]